MFERELRTLAHVPRWSIIRTIRTQSVAEHSYYTAIYADQIAEYIEWKGDRFALMRFAMIHDMDEMLSGDIASPAKAVLQQGGGWRRFKDWTINLMSKRFHYFKDWFLPINSEMYQILNVADWLEGVLFLCDEEFLGNKNVRDVKTHCVNKLFEAVKLLPTSDKLKNDVDNWILKSIHYHSHSCDALAIDEMICPDIKDYMTESLSESEEGES